jgi:hypothetical protein
MFLTNRPYSGSPFRHTGIFASRRARRVVERPIIVVPTLKARPIRGLHCRPNRWGFAGAVSVFSRLLFANSSPDSVGSRGVRPREPSTSGCLISPTLIRRRSRKEAHMSAHRTVTGLQPCTVAVRIFRLRSPCGCRNGPVAYALKDSSGVVRSAWSRCVYWTWRRSHTFRFGRPPVPFVEAGDVAGRSRNHARRRPSW